MQHQTIITDSSKLRTSYRSCSYKQTKGTFGFPFFIQINKNKKMKTFNQFIKEMDETTPDPNQPTYETYKELLNTAIEQQESRDSDIATRNLLVYLGYSALGLFIIIIGVVMYKKFGEKPIKELEKKLGGYINKMLK